MNSNNSDKPSKTPPLGGLGAHFFPKISFELIGKKLRQDMLRFHLKIVCILTLAVLMIVNIHNHFSHQIDERLWWFLGLSIPLSLAFYLYAENRINCLLKNGLNILLVGLIAWFTFTLAKPIIDAETIRMIAIGVSFGLAVFFAPYITGKRPLSFWEYVQELVIQLITSYVFAGILITPVLWLFNLRGIEIWVALAGGLVIAFRFLADWNRQYRQLWLDMEKQ